MERWSTPVVMLSFRRSFLNPFFLPCGTLWPSVCFLQKLPVCFWWPSDASPPPAARTVCRNTHRNRIQDSDTIRGSKTVVVVTLEQYLRVLWCISETSSVLSSGVQVFIPSTLFSLESLPEGEQKVTSSYFDHGRQRTDNVKVNILKFLDFRIFFKTISVSHCLIVTPSLSTD